MLAWRISYCKESLAPRGAQRDTGDRYSTPKSLFRLHAVGALANQRQEFGASFFFVAEGSEHRRSHRGGVLLFDAAHHHAEMAGFDDDADALRFDYFLNGLGDLGGEAFLNLEAAREQFDEAWNFAETDDASVGNIGDVHLAEEWQ